MTTAQTDRLLKAGTREQWDRIWDATEPAPDSNGNQRWREADLAAAHYAANKVRFDAEDTLRRFAQAVESLP